MVVLGASGCVRHSMRNAELDDLVVELEQLIPEQLEGRHVPGAAVAVLRDGQVVYQRGFGLADEGRPIEPTTGFNVASISKPVAAWGVMKLVEDGKVDLDAPFRRYVTRWSLPESAHDADQVTVRRLLSHTAGLSLHGYPGFGPDDRLPTIEESLSGATNGSGAVELVRQPGTEWKYSGGGYTLLQLLIEEVSGQTFADFMRETVLRPLGMKGSDYELTPEILAASATCFDASGESAPSPRFTAQAAAGLHATLEDMGRFAVATLSMMEEGPGRTVLSRESLELMLTAASASEGRYGLGYFLRPLPNGVPAMGHDGANEGWHSSFLVVPETGDGLVVLTNGDQGRLITAEIRCAWMHWLTGLVPTELPCGIPLPEKRHEIELSDEVLRRYVGVYEVEAGFQMAIRLENGLLRAKATDQVEMPIYPESETEFFVKLFEGEVTFVLDGAGEVTGLVLRKGEWAGEARKVE